MRILLATDMYQPMVGGVPTVTAHLATGLARRGHEVHVVAPASDRQESLLPAPAVTEHLVPSLAYPFYPGLRLVVHSSAVSAALHEAAPQVAHVHSPMLLGRHVVRAATRVGVPVIVTNHYVPANALPRLRSGSVADHLISPAFYWYLRSVYRSASLVTAPTQAAVRLLEMHGVRAPTKVVSNGVDLSRFKPAPQDEQLRSRLKIPTQGPVLLSLGRLSREKRVDLIIEAMGEVGTRATLTIAGTGPDEARLRKRVHQMGLARTVRFLGHVAESDLPGLYRLADLFVMASPVELQSLATMNALASGVPVVAADAGALPELLSESGAGRLFRAGDSAALSSAVAAVLTDIDSRRGKARAAVLKHDFESVLWRWEELYREVAAKSGASARGMP